MIRTSILFFLLLISPFLVSQNWDSIRGGLPNDLIETVLFDSIHNELIISSKFLNKIGSLSVRGIARWNGTRWDSLAGGINTHDKQSNPNNPNANITDCISYNGECLVSGGFISIGGIPATGLALWNGFSWDSLPKRAFKYNINGGTDVRGFEKFNNLLYIYGSFDTIANQKTNSVATWDGNNFNTISILNGKPGVGITDMTIYNNELYLSGGYFTSSTYTNNADVLKFNGTTWISTTGTGVLGFAGSVGTMAVYNNELYAGGHFLISDGNVANNIMKWDGFQWKDVGFGNSTSFVTVRKLLVHNNKLWAFGCYNKAAYMPTYCVSVFDGLKWCILQDTVDNCLSSATIYNDTIYIGGGFFTAGGDPHITNLAKLKNETLIKSCNNVGVNELTSMNQLNLFPNPVSFILTLKIDQYFEKGTEIEITNPLGKIVFKLNYTNEIDVSSLPSGYYTLKIRSSDGRQLHSKFIKE